MRKTLESAAFLLAISCFGHPAFAAEPTAGFPARPLPTLTNPRPDDALFASPTRHDRIGRIVAPVMINGQGPFRLVVDTGASHTTLSPELVLRLGLEPRDHGVLLLNGVTGSEEVPSVVIDRLEAGDLLVRGVKAPIVTSGIMAGADGILGVAGLTEERITVDFRRDRISIARVKSKADLGGLLRIPGTRVAGGLLMVMSRVGGIRTRVVIDTGAERTLGNAALRNELRLRKRVGRAREVTSVFGTTADISDGELLSVPTITLGSAKIDQVNVVFGDFHIFKVWELNDKPTLLLGMDVLGTVEQLIIDYSLQEVYVRA